MDASNGNEKELPSFEREKSPSFEGSEFRHARMPSDVLSETLKLKEFQKRIPSLANLELLVEKDKRFNLSFSHASLVLFWLGMLIGGTLCFALCEAYQEFYPDFPLMLLLGVGIIFHCACALTIYPLGIQRYGKDKYHFYQPFHGGLKFVVIQIAGIFCIALSHIVLWVYALAFNPKKVISGVITVFSIISLAGSALLFYSIYCFKPNNDPLSPRDERATKINKIFSLLMKSPNTESAIVVFLFLGELFLGAFSTLFPQMWSWSSYLFFAIHLVSLIYTHFIVGCKHTKNYKYLMLSLRNRYDTVIYWALGGVVWFSLYANAFAVNNAKEVSSPVFVAVPTLNVFACGLLLLFIRTTDFCNVRQKKEDFSEVGVLLVSCGVILLAIFQLFCIYFMHFYSGSTTVLIEGTSWTKQKCFQVCLQASQLFSILITPTAYFSGKIMFGPRFSMFSDESRENIGFLLTHCISWSTYVAFIISTAVFFCNLHILAASVSTFTMTVSVLSMIFSMKLNYMHDSDPMKSPLSMGTKMAAPKHLYNAVNDAENVLMNTRMQLSELQIKHLMNSELIIGYSMFFTNVVLRATVDFSHLNIWGEGNIPNVQLIAVANVCFLCCVPLVHLSGRDKGVKMFLPFSGDGTYIALQVLGWAFYAYFVLFFIFTAVIFVNQSSLIEYLLKFSGIPFSSSLLSLLEAVPLILITISVAVESAHQIGRLRLRTIALESYEQIFCLAKEAHDAMTDEKEQEIVQLAFRTVMEPALKYYQIPATRKMLTLLAHSTSPASPNEDDEDSLQLTASERQEKQDNAAIIVVFMCVASALFYVIAAFFAQLTEISLGFAICGVFLMSCSCLGLNILYGPIMHPPRPGKQLFEPFMPFRGGSKFFYRQIIGWSCYAGALLVTLVSSMEYNGISPSAMIFASILSVVSQLFILSSIPLFESGPVDKPSYLEEHGEGIVALLLFVGSFLFSYAYEMCVAFFAPEEKLQFSFYHVKIGQGSERHHRVPFVITLIVIILAVPCIFIALNRSSKNWEIIANKRKVSNKMAQLSSNYDGPDSSWSVALIIRNLFEVLSLSLGMIIPVSVIALLYFFTHSYTPKLISKTEEILPYFLMGLSGILFLSIMPYVVNIKMPKSFIVIRYTLVTWCQYGMAVTCSALLLTPAFIYPCLGTFSTFVYTFVITVLGGYKQVRLLLRLSVYCLIGYRTYQEYLLWATGSWTKSKSVSYLIDFVLLLIWGLYFPTYEHAPSLSGKHRSMWFTNFARNYLFSDCAKYFSFRVLLDDPSVDMSKGETQFLFSFHPHGVFPGTALFCSLTKEWRDKVGLHANRYVSTHAASIIFNVPIIRDYNMLLGCLSVSRRGIESSLKRGNSVLIVTGGQAEMLHTAISSEEMILVTQHTGFIRLAIDNNVPLVPLLCFAENNVMGLIHFPRIQRVMLKILGFPFPMIPFGRFGLPLPRKTPLTLVVGKPLKIPAGYSSENPEHIEKLSEMYFKDIKELFYRHREEAGYPNMELKLVNDKKERELKKKMAEEAKQAELNNKKK